MSAARVPPRKRTMIVTAIDATCKLNLEAWCGEQRVTPPLHCAGGTRPLGCHALDGEVPQRGDERAAVCRRSLRHVTILLNEAPMAHLLAPQMRSCVSLQRH